MLNRKGLLNGLGIGLILGAILLQLMNTVDGSSDRELANVTELTTTFNFTQFNEVAVRNGYQLLSVADLDAIVEKKVAEEKEKLPAVASAPLPENTIYIKKIAVYLSGGLNAFEVADALHRSGVIEDREQFLQALSNANLTAKIRSGYYEFDGVQEIEHVILRIVPAA